MNIVEAIAIAGTLSNPEKMPGKSTSIDARRCITGSKLAKKRGSVCEHCYARTGRYRMPNVRAAMERRLDGIQHPLWVLAMSRLLQRQHWFRWFDSGDLQSVAHLRKIIAVCNATPNVRHWLPTKEHGIVRQFLKHGGVLPENLTVRLSAHMRDEIFASDLPTSMVVDLRPTPEGVWDCPAYAQNSKHTCESARCRACWDRGTTVVAYPLHKHGAVKEG